MDQHQKYLEAALEIARENALSGDGGPFGAIVVKDGKIIASSGNKVLLKNDPTAHAEVEAIRQAGKALENFHLTGCTIYSSCEPCPMCLSAIYWAHIEAVYFVNTKEEAALTGFDDHFIYEEIEKPIEARKLIMKQIHVPLGHEPFEVWNNLESKKPY